MLSAIVIFLKSSSVSAQYTPIRVVNCQKDCTTTKQTTIAACYDIADVNTRQVCLVAADVRHYNCFDRCRNINGCTPDCIKLKSFCLNRCDTNNPNNTLNKLRCKRTCHEDDAAQVTGCFQTCYRTNAPTTSPAPTAPTANPTKSPTQSPTKGTYCTTTRDVYAYDLCVRM